jgi:hypothetical protein
LDLSTNKNGFIPALPLTEAVAGLHSLPQGALEGAAA